MVCVCVCVVEGVNTIKQRRFCLFVIQRHSGHVMKTLVGSRTEGK